MSDMDADIDMDMLETFSGESLAPENAEFLPRTHSHAICALQLDMHWRSEHVTHVDCLYLPRVNLWREIFPAGMENAILDQPTGYSESITYPAGELVSAWQGNQVLKPRPKLFNNHFGNSGYIEPRAGRFYPKGIIAGAAGVYAGEHKPLRVIATDPLETDINHPLAKYDMAVAFRIDDIWSAGGETGGACEDIAELLTSEGPGMQARWRDQATDFWQDIPFSRMAPEADGAYYQLPKMAPHLDKVACSQISDLLNNLLIDGSQVLDLMTGAHTHLSAALKNTEVIGVGLNQEELEANPVLNKTLVHDVNIDVVLPFDDYCFNAVICTDAVEYMAKPIETFKQVNRILKPGGIFILQFSNRWDSVKAVKVWSDIHEFERLGLVLEYFFKAENFTHLHTRSIRGLLRPTDDTTAPKLLKSDPVYAVWGYKA